MPLVFVLAVGAFASGVGTGGTSGTPQASLAVWIYYAAGLFVFGGLDLGLPEGGTAFARVALWIAYFLAPAITTTALVEAVLRVVRPDWLYSLWRRNHVVVVGAGQVGILYLDAVRSVDPGRTVLLVDRSADLATAAEAARRPGVSFLQGDAQRSATIEALNLDHARGMVVVTDSDLVNLEAGWAALTARPDLPVAVHVADLTLLRPVHRAGGKGGPTGFNTHQIGARYVYHQHLEQHFVSTGHRDVVVLAGFGRFAQTIAELLLDEAWDEVARLVIVGRNATREVRQFEEDVRPLPDSTVILDGEVDDPATWTAVMGSVEEEEGEPVYLLCDRAEVVNLRAALLVRNRAPGARVFARTFHRSIFVESLAAAGGFEVMAFEEMLRQALREHYRGTFGGA